MRVFSYSEARQNFASILNMATEEDVVIAKKDGTKFKIVPLTKNESKSPFDVPGIKSNITTKEILEIMKEARETF
ncbi:type II toxin-antitoxin system Phd/YefM family antitoxin [Sediminispirochaeta smaragdinae]|uniref:Antitoxin n=1 Tax=Sediminispirochaeta smaragdinae (strain DSM 11293 / JCM 15392 / SEBR 4228) TaxID=573413 RepID=E1RBV1_SEDSS|nr:type II toxin-antitoxin system Phd/YefM family antitoxin [Sediminispirochaeta smaragdinae]ADK79831.1 prevent-host-death family protein [Sediminispirochaeta smaragdinae DSM 11293]